MAKELSAAEKKAEEAAAKIIADAEKKAEEVAAKIIADAEKKAEEAGASKAPVAGRYEAVTASEDYNGISVGVQFRNGTAIFDNLTLDKSLGYSLDQVVLKMIDMNYQVFEIDADGNQV